MPTIDTILLASRNAHKAGELRYFLRDLPVTIRTIDEVPGVLPIEEDGLTFRENALKKARETYRLSGFPSLADDSGLEVFYLNGRPGVVSARYAGHGATDEANNEKLLAELRGVAPRRRAARFVATLALVGPGIEEVCAGQCSGSIMEVPRGSNGFGYDPLFCPDGFTRTYAELTQEEKNRISHRSRAFASMREVLLHYMR